MRMDDSDCPLIVDEIDLIAEHLPMDGARVLELGCGAAQATRKVAERFRIAEMLATEVDEIQHAKNLAARAIPGVRFTLGGAERIAAEDATFDTVLMFKSLHHVPQGKLDAALSEIARVLRPGGLAWISEPIFRGNFNEVMRIFHDEQRVREAAFAALRRAVDDGVFESAAQLFFSVERSFIDFAEFEQQMIGVTHTEHRLDAALLSRVRVEFEKHLSPDGARFEQPMRVDVLRATGGIAEARK